jgi:pyruvate,water dikinase
LVFYATHEELANYFNDGLPKTKLAQSIATRQAEWQTYQHEFEESPTETYPPFLRGEGVVGVRGNAEVRGNIASTENQWRGRAVSPGMARGVARVVQSSSDLSRVQHGEILVAPSTDPAWTPVFTRIAGLIVERGGVLSHSAVVAREYHLPAVAGIPNIVAEIHDGDLIEVDGSRGVVSAIIR